MTRFWNVILGVFRQYQNTKTILEKKNMGQNCFKKYSKFQKFQLRSFTLTWSNNEKVNDLLKKKKNYSKKMNMLNKLILKNI